MFDHDDDLEDLMAPTPDGDRVSIHGNRQTKVTLVIDKNIERNPERDSRALAFYLSTSIDAETLKLLAERLFYEFIAPNISLDNLQKNSVPQKRGKRSLDDSKD